MNYKTYVVISIAVICLILLCGCIQPRSYIMPINESAPSHFDIKETKSVEIPKSTPTPQVYLKCSDYHQIKDRYKTPDEKYFIVIQNDTLAISESQYENVSIGGYVKLTYFATYSYYWSNVVYSPTTDGTYSNSYVVDDFAEKLVRKSEAETGYRDACIKEAKGG